MKTARPASARRGAALLIVIVMSITLMALVAALITMSQQAGLESTVRTEYSRTLESPESGLNKVMQDI